MEDIIKVEGVAKAYGKQPRPTASIRCIRGLTWALKKANALRCSGLPAAAKRF